MLTCLVLCHFATVVWLHADPTPHTDWLPVIIPGVGVVVLALIGMAVYYYLKFNQPGLPTEQTEEGKGGFLWKK